MSEPQKSAAPPPEMPQAAPSAANPPAPNQKPPPVPLTQKAGAAVAVLLISMAVPSIRHTILGAFGFGVEPAAVGQQQAGEEPPPPPTEVVETPRSGTPMGEYSRFFARKNFSLLDTAANVRRTIPYYWFQPEGAPYPPGLKFPLVVTLHDAKGQVYAPVYLLGKQMRLDYPAFILIPQSTGGPPPKVWSQPEKLSGKEFETSPQAKGAFSIPYPPDRQSLPDVIELIGETVAKYPVDEDRIYIVGCAEGGTGVYGAAANYPQVFAGGIVIGGGWSYLDAAKMKGMPLLIMHGAENKTVNPSVARGMADLIPRNGGSAVYSELPGYADDCAIGQLYGPPVWKWLFGQKKRMAAR
jgi:hypothetical protein